MYYKISKITHKDGTLRTEPEYIKRTGRIVGEPIPSGNGIVMEYYRDRDGTPMQWKGLYTSPVEQYERFPSGLRIETENSVYWLNEVSMF